MAALLHSNSGSSIRLLESDKRYLLHYPGVTEPSFKFEFLVLNFLKDNAGNVIGRDLVTDYNVICSRSDFSLFASVHRECLQYHLAAAGLSPPDIQDLLAEIESRAKSIAHGRDAEFLIPLMVYVEMYQESAGDRRIEGEITAFLESELKSEMAETFMEDDDEESEPEDYLQSSEDEDEEEQV